MKLILKYKIVFIILHLLIGYLLLNSAFGIVFSVLLYIVSLVQVILTKNKNDIALYWAIYLVSYEVAFRMTNSLIFYESIKYWVSILLIVGIIVQRKRIRKNLFFIIYLFIMVLSIVYTKIPYDVNFRKAVLFDLSGPALLGFASLYTYKLILTKKDLIKLIHISILPVISLLVILYIRTPDLKDIIFRSGANFATSGGFGPNQVATILGWGIFGITVLLITKSRFTGFLIFDILLLAYLIYRGIITFSRGGVWAAFLVLLVFAFFYLKSQGLLIKYGVKYFLVALVLGFFVWQYSLQVTNGMIYNRYSGKNASGVEKQDITSGRINIFMSEIEIFFKYPILGSGIGSARYEREKLHPEMDAASHNEMSRLISEHGIFGVFLLLSLITIPLVHIYKLDSMNKAFLLSFYLFWFLTINHSAMRIAFPGFIYSLSLIYMVNEKNTLHRK